MLKKNFKKTNECEIIKCIKGILVKAWCPIFVAEKIQSLFDNCMTTVRNNAIMCLENKK